MTALLALRERARRWLGLVLVKAGVHCLHTLDSNAWRPCALDVGPGYVAVPGRVCRYCDERQELDEAEFYAYFGRPYIWVRSV